MKKRKRWPPVEWDGLCGHPSGLRTPEEIEKIAQAKLKAMEEHPGLKWLRDEDEEANRTPIGGTQFHARHDEH